jgi:hypothetical protein
VFKLNHFSIVNSTILITGIFFLATPALAIHPEEKAEIENLKKRIEVLESQQETESGDQEPGLDFGRINKYVTLHGLLEVEASYLKPDGGDEESDLTLATAELAIEATLNDYAGGHLTLLYEEEDGEDDDIDVDEAVISLRSPGQLFGQSPSLHVGRMYVPFGAFNSYMISDPLTLELGETQSTAALFALEGDVWTIKTSTFNGNTDTDGDNDNIDSLVVSLQVAAGENLSFGVSYINDLAESDIELVQEESLYSSSVAGASAFLSAKCGKFGFEAEYLTALEDFDSTLVTVGEDLTGRRPEAWNFELAWMPTEKVQVAARYEQAKDFQDDVRRYGSTVSYGLLEHVLVSIEYLHADAKVKEDDPLDAVTAQLALEF